MAPPFSPAARRGALVPPDSVSHNRPPCRRPPTGRCKVNIYNEELLPMTTVLVIEPTATEAPMREGQLRVGGSVSRIAFGYVGCAGKVLSCQGHNPERDAAGGQTGPNGSMPGTSVFPSLWGVRIVYSSVATRAI
jgi:hypothetical protein